MNLPLARFALRLLGHSRWHGILLALAVAAASGWLAVRTIAAREAIARAEAAARAWPAVIASVTDARAADACGSGAEQAQLAGLAGVGSARAVVECRRVGHELEVAREEEVEAIASEAAELLGAGWELTTRSRLSTATIAALERQAGLATLSATPIVLALVLLVVTLGHGGHQAREVVGKLKLVGFTSGQAAWVLGLRSWLPCAVGALVGVAGAALAMATGTTAALGTLATPSDAVGLSWSATFDAALAVMAFVLAPCFVAAMAPAVLLARADPARVLEGE